MQSGACARTKAIAWWLEENLFIEQVLPAMVMRPLSDAEMEEYRRPYVEPGEGRRAMRAWPQELPIDGEPADNVAAIRSYADWLSQSEVPKLFVNGNPGMSLVDEQREFCRRWPNQREVTVKGIITTCRRTRRMKSAGPWRRSSRR